MSESIKDKMQEAGHKISETATKVGNRVSEGVEKATDWAKEKTHEAGNRLNEMSQKAGHKMEEVAGSGSSSCGASRSTSAITEHMEVFSSCGCKVGKVDHVEGNEIKLTKSDSPDGFHHLIPAGWVDHVDNHVHLNVDAAQARQDWQTV